jgi:hypothetical protein
MKPKAQAFRPNNFLSISWPARPLLADLEANVQKQFRALLRRDADSSYDLCCQQSGASAHRIYTQETLQPVTVPSPTYQEHPHGGCHPDDHHIQRLDRPQVKKLRQGRHERNQ